MNQEMHEKWIEIDIDCVKNNLQEVKALVGEKTRLVAVIKANAYGHGAISTARILYQNGVDFFAVSFLHEALQLRRAGIRANILVFSPVWNEKQIQEARDNHLTISVTSPEGFQIIQQVMEGFGHPLNIHLKMETGLGRFGLNLEEALEICNIAKTNSNLYIEGIYTHMAEAANRDYTEKQFATFMKLIEELRNEGFHIPVRHCANSAVFLKYPEMHLEAVRIGTLLSGQYPMRDDSRLKLKDPYQFKTRVISVKEFEADHYIGYFRSYKLKNASKVAVIPVGYQDGLAVEIANKAAGLIDLLKLMIKQVLTFMDVPRFSTHVIIKGKKYPVRGKVFMQLALVVLPSDADIKVGDEAIVPIRKTLSSTSTCRIYMKDGEAVKIEEEERSTYALE